MNALEPHRTEALGVYALGVLDDQEMAEIEEHLVLCAECRTELAVVKAMRETLGEIPPEAFLDGPAVGGDLLLQRTLRAMRAERSTARRGLRMIGTAAAAMAAVLAIGGGVLLGEHGSAGQDTAAGATTAPSTAKSTVIPGSRIISGVSAGVRLAATITPAAGWIRVNASVAGIPAGERCQLIVVSRSGQEVVAGSWLVSPKLAASGVDLDGSALIAPDQVASVQVRNLTGHRFVTANA